MARQVVFSPSNFVKAIDALNSATDSEVTDDQFVLFQRTLPQDAKSRAGHTVGICLSDTKLTVYDFTEGKAISHVLLTEG